LTTYALLGNTLTPQVVFPALCTKSEKREERREKREERREKREETEVGS
jgi:hypothetical protein